MNSEAKILSVTFEPNCLYYEFYCDSCLSVVKNDDFNYADTEDEALRSYGKPLLRECEYCSTLYKLNLVKDGKWNISSSQSEETEICPECKNTGWYIGLNKKEPCSLGCKPA